MSVFKALTTAMLTLTAQTLLVVSSAPAVLVTLEMESSPVVVMKTDFYHKITSFIYPVLACVQASAYQ